MKTLYLRGGSWIVLLFALRTGYATPTGHVVGARVLLASFTLWLRAWLEWLRGGNGSPMFCSAPETSGLNRKARRVSRCKISSLRNLSPYRLLLGWDLSPAQFIERVSRMSPLGRVRLMRIWRWATRQQYQAMLTCYDLGWWREPIGFMGRVRCGVWCEHLWPEWARYV